MQDRIERHIELKVPVERVWRALTDHEEFGVWFRVKLASPFVVGEVTRGQVTYEGYEHLKWEATVTAMEPERLFSFSWHPCENESGDDGLEEPQTLVEFKLEPAASGSRLTITESGFSTIPDTSRRAEAFRVNSQGWDMQVENIAAYVEA